MDVKKEKKGQQCLIFSCNCWHYESRFPYFHEVLFITILTNLLHFLTQTEIYTNSKCFIYFEFNKEQFV